MSDASVAFIAALGSVMAAAVSAYGLVKASRAEKNTRPISNGFAGTVKASLSHLEAHLDDVHKDIREVRQAVTDHLQTHVEAVVVVSETTAPVAVKRTRTKKSA
jgi:predicted component of type VI protein secretion system